MTSLFTQLFKALIMPLGILSDTSMNAFPILGACKRTTIGGIRYRLVLVIIYARNKIVLFRRSHTDKRIIQIFHSHSFHHLIGFICLTMVQI